MNLKANRFTFAPDWQQIASASENKGLVGTSAQRLFAPRSGVGGYNGFLGEKEVLVGGLEYESVTLKVYQPSVDRYSRLTIAPELLQVRNRNGHSELGRNQGIGTIPGGLAIAGGVSSGSTPACGSTVLTVDSSSRKTTRLCDLDEARAAPMVVGSPDGRYLLIAGGVTYDRNARPSVTDGVELIDRQTGEHADIDRLFPGLRQLPVERFGGSAVWVKDGEVDRIFFVGGSIGKAFGGFDEAQATPRFDVYTTQCGSGGWTDGELSTARMYPGVGVRALPDCSKEVVIAGGGTGNPGGGRVDPQLYSVDRIGVRDLGVSFGQHVPEQPAVRTGEYAAREWSSNALVFLAGDGRCNAAETAYLFGFSRAYKGTTPMKACDPEQPGKPVQQQAAQAD